MSMQHIKNQQRGSVLLLMVLVMSIIVATMLLSRMNSRDVDADKATRDVDVLAQAKAALIAWSRSHEWSALDATKVRPGELPSPDNDLPSSAAYGLQDSNGPSVGRLPWRTLGLPELKDASGEALWYVVEPSFRDNQTGTLACPNPATLKAYGSDGKEWQVGVGNCILAIIFAPGAALTGQTRPTIISTDYLELITLSGINMRNSHQDGPFIQGPQYDAQRNIVLNDRMIVVTWNDLRLPIVIATPIPTAAVPTLPGITPTPAGVTSTPIGFTPPPFATPTATLVPTPVNPNPDKCPTWEVGSMSNPYPYTLGARVKWKGNAYQCITAHTSYGDASWSPDQAPALWKYIGTVGSCNKVL